jgi:hypothetical protein
MVRAFQIDILKEVKDQIWHQMVSNNYTSEETRAYLDTIGIIEEKIDEINKSMDETIEEMNDACS